MNSFTFPRNIAVSNLSRFIDVVDLTQSDDASDTASSTLDFYLSLLEYGAGGVQRPLLPSFSPETTSYESTFALATHRIQILLFWRAKKNQLLRSSSDILDDFSPLVFDDAWTYDEKEAEKRFANQSSRSYFTGDEELWMEKNEIDSFLLSIDLQYRALKTQLSDLMLPA